MKLTLAQKRILNESKKLEKLNYEQLIQWDKNDLAEYILNLYDKIQN
jgi:4-diphosphocytidyl-2C-methyl-D-erythritol kinase